METPEDRQREALGVLKEHYIILAKQVAEEIIEHKEEFESFGFGKAQNIIEKYARHIDQLGAVYAMLQGIAGREKPEGKMPLGKYDFRCFGCGGLIQSTDDRCPTCGWTWV